MSVTSIIGIARGAIAPAVIAIGMLAATLPATAAGVDVPAPGASPRIDAIKKSGELRVAVLANPPWLLENTTGSGDQWSGPAWVLAEEFAKRLGVKLKPVLVSHETKVPVLAADQVDLTITPLAVTPEREKVIDFILYTTNSMCLFGRTDDQKFARAKTLDDLNQPDVTIAYFIGGGHEDWLKARFPKAKLLGVSNTGAVAPLEDIEAGRADVAPVNRIAWLPMAHKVKGLGVLPRENDCQDSTERATPGGMAIDKGQPVLLDWMRAVEKEIHGRVHAAELDAVRSMQ